MIHGTLYIFTCNSIIMNYAATQYVHVWWMAKWLYRYVSMYECPVQFPLCTFTMTATALCTTWYWGERIGGSFIQTTVQFYITHYSNYIIDIPVTLNTFLCIGCKCISTLSVLFVFLWRGWKLWFMITMSII